MEFYNRLKHGLRILLHKKSKIMITYRVNLTISKFDGNSKHTSESFDYDFSSGYLVYDREFAINKAKDLIGNIDDFLPDGESFSSYEEAKLLGLKDFNCYYFSINLVDEEGLCPIYGDGGDDQYDWLEYEAQIFKKKYPDVKFAFIENPSGDLVEVIEADLDFLLEN
jgi:hypothetical protein